MTFKPKLDKNDNVLLGGKCRKRLYIGKVSDRETSHRGARVYMDAEYPHVCFVCGKRGSGKSYTLGVFAEELAGQDVATVLLDPIGVFWSMKAENQNDRETKLLKEYGLTPGKYDVNLFKAGERKTDLFQEYSITTSELEPEDWCALFDIDRFSIQGLFISQMMSLLKSGYYTSDGDSVDPNEEYDLNDMLECAENAYELCEGKNSYASTTRRSIGARLRSLLSLNLFCKQGTALTEVCQPSKLSIVDISDAGLEIGIKSLICALIARSVLKNRIESVHNIEQRGGEAIIPQTWLLIDEVHLMVPHRGSTVASKPLIEYAKLGRKPGCALVLATQRPAATSDDILSQADIMVGHSLGLSDDISAFVKRVPSKLTYTGDDIRAIRLGEAIMSDQETQDRAFLMSFRPRRSHHAGNDVPSKLVNANPINPPSNTTRNNIVHNLTVTPPDDSEEDRESWFSRIMNSKIWDHLGTLLIILLGVFIFILIGIVYGVTGSKPRMR